MLHTLGRHTSTHREEQYFMSAKTDIKRIDSYEDERFSKTALQQHGAYLVDDSPYEIVITSRNKAVVNGADNRLFDSLIEEFRYHAPHITEFVDRQGRQIKSFPPDDIVEIKLDSIQPSQFYIDEEKINAIAAFIKTPEDVIVQVIKWNDRYISLDGHTRLFYAYKRGFTYVNAVIADVEDWVWDFVREANARNIYKVSDMTLLPHDEYEIKWNQFCRDFFA